MDTREKLLEIVVCESTQDRTQVPVGHVLQATIHSVDDIRNDATAECRWWNTLRSRDRNAFVNGANAPDDCARHDWLDIGETNRYKILTAAHAVECWLDADRN